MVVSILEVGLMVNRMDRVYLSLKMDRKKEENGKMELEKDGLSSKNAKS